MDVTPRRSLLHLIHDRNPFFLLSALCMFTGYRIVLGAINSAPGDLRHLLMLIVTLNVYETLLLGLALFLIVRRGLRRDGWFLLSIEALFLVDLTNLNAEFFTASQRYGSVVNGVCFVLAMVKILAVVRVLGLRLSPGTVFYIAAQLAFLFGLPGIFRQMSHRGAVTPLQIYGIWWALAALLVGGAVLARKPTRGADSAMAAAPWRLYVLVPFASLLVHLAGENRVYWVHFHPANAGPILLALAVALSIVRRQLMGVPLALVALAVCVSAGSGPDAFKWAGILISPLRLALVASAVITFVIFARSGWWLAVQAAAVAGVLAVLGANVDQMLVNATWLMHWAVGLLKRAVPETALQWGYFAIGLAFALLGVGAVFSLRRKMPPV